MTERPTGTDSFDGLTPERLVKVMRAFSEGLERHRSVVNRLNVYPVPDGDTGTNMALTLESVVKALDGLDLEAAGGDAMGVACRAIASGSLMGARGNSGVILCQILRGISGTFAPLPVVGAHEAAVALSEGSAAARAGVMRPVEGTMLTVAADAAAAAWEVDEQGGGDLTTVFEAASRAAVSSLWRTPDLLPVLAQAGVVDAGGAGLVLLYEAFLHVIDGRAMAEELPLPPEVAERIAGGFEASWAAAPGAKPAARTGVSGNGSRHNDAARARSASPNGEASAIGDLRYEVMYFLEAPDEALGAFKAVWAGIGDSIVVVGGDGLWNCHIHTDDIGAAIEAALDAGRPRDIRVTDLLDQVEEEFWVRRASELAASPASLDEPAPITSVVAVATGDGIRRIFYSLGVHHIVGGGQSMNPSTEQILEVVDSVPGAEVVILPNNKNIVAVAEQVRQLSKKPAFVVATHGIQEGFAALLEYDPGAGAQENAEAMSAAASRVRAGEVTRAVRASDSEAGPIEAGNFIGLSRNGIESVAGTLPEATCGLLQKMLGDSDEIVTLIEGAGATTADTRRVSEWLRENWPGISLELHHGGQPLYPYLVSVE
ncbi:MAG: DAK2 domain-containing protein [Acidimicrobiales bacterium]